MIDVRIEGHIRITTFSGAVSGAELLDISRRTLDSSSYDPSLDSLADLRAVTSIDFNASDVSEVSILYEKAGGGRRRRMAVVATTPVAYGYARAFEMQGGADMKIFTTLEDARTWLGLPSAEPAP